MRHATNAYTWEEDGMSVRKRTWFTETDVKMRATALMKQDTRVRRGHIYEDRAREELRKEPTREAWIVDFVDQAGERHIQTFARKKDADEYHDKVRVNVRAGVHTSSKLTIAEAGAKWIEDAEDRLEPATREAYRHHLGQPIRPYPGSGQLVQPPLSPW